MRQYGDYRAYRERGERADFYIGLNDYGCRFGRYLPMVGLRHEHTDRRRDFTKFYRHGERQLCRSPWLIKLCENLVWRSVYSWRNLVGGARHRVGNAPRVPAFAVSGSRTVATVQRP